MSTSNPTVVGAIITAGAAFIGVALAEIAKFLTVRWSESRAIRAEHYEARKELLLAYRAFRRHLMQPDVNVELLAEETGEHAGRTHTVIRLAADQWHRLDSAWIDFRLTEPSKDLIGAAEELRQAWYAFAESRATYLPGTIPTAVLHSVRLAEEGYLTALRNATPSRVLPSEI